MPPQNHFRILSVRMKTGAALVIAATIACSCGKQQSRAVSVDVDTLANVYAELLVLNERFDLGRDSLSAGEYEREYRTVLQSHKYTKEEFESQIQSVAASPENFKLLCERALTRFQEMRRKAPRIGISANS